MRPPTSETANNPWWDPIFFPLIIYSLGLGLSFLQLLALQLERFIFFPLYAFPIHAEWLGQYALCGGWANYFQPYVLPVEIWSFSSHINHTVSLIHFLVLLEVKPFWIFFVFYVLFISWINSHIHNSLQDILLLLDLISTVLSLAGFPNKAASTFSPPQVIDIN